jgi:methionyl-tRNA synthetase
VNVPANEFLNLEGDKISTTRFWAVWLHEYLDDFPGKEDVIEVCFSSKCSGNQGQRLYMEGFPDATINSELLSILGNYCEQNVVLTHKYFGGRVPVLGSLTTEDRILMEEISQFPGRISASMEAYRFREALAEFMNLARLGNKYLTDQEPWKKYGKEDERVQTILNLSLQICANLATLGEPFLPFTTARMRKC